MSWKHHIPGCFGIQNLLFGGQPIERSTAHRMLEDVSNDNASLQDLLDEAEKYLSRKTRCHVTLLTSLIE